MQLQYPHLRISILRLILHVGIFSVRLINNIIILGHELLFKEVILNASSVAPQNYTTVFNYDDQDKQIVTFAKFQIDGVSLIVLI